MVGQGRHQIAYILSPNRINFLIIAKVILCNFVERLKTKKLTCKLIYANVIMLLKVLLLSSRFCYKNLQKCTN